LCYYFFRSLILRGPLAHFKLLFQEWLYERKFGIHTAGFKKSNSQKHNHYQAASYLVLNRIFKYLAPKTKDYAFYDIGCGKGRVLFMAAKFGYKNLNGIELDKDLLEEAKSNLAGVISGKKEFILKLYDIDVLEHLYENQASVYFLFNPFDAEVLNLFLKRVISHNNQDCYFVYMNPIHSSVFEQLNFLKHHVFRSFLYTEAIIYHLPPRQNKL